MSYIPEKAMHHAHGEPEADATDQAPEAGRSRALGWMIGAAGAGVVAVTAAALLSLRSSSATKPVKRRARRTTTRRAPAKGRRTAKKAA